MLNMLFIIKKGEVVLKERKCHAEFNSASAFKLKTEIKFRVKPGITVLTQPL